METSHFWNRLVYGLVLLLVGSCVDPYKPPAISAPNKYLVVDGHLNGGTGITTLKLTRTQNLSDFSAPTPELKALLQVEGESGGVYPFVEAGSGVYTLTAILAFGQNYRLRIKTSAGGEYLSDLITIKQTPKIDSVSWAVENNGVQLYANTHDPTNNTRYYRWEYEDTYEIITPYYSPFEYKNGKVIDRVVTNINHCWRTQPSTNIILGNTARLSQDVVQKAPVLFIPASSPKLAIKYSFLLKQYAQSAESYTYWQTLQKNTEQLGSLFDPLPSQIAGNMHSLKDATEPVLGYVDGYSTEQLRVFVDRPAQLPFYLIVSGYESCHLDTLPLPESRSPLSAFIGPGGGYNAVEYLGPNMYLGAAVSCTDCTNLGTTTKPSYWP